MAQSKVDIEVLLLHLLPLLAFIVCIARLGAWAAVRLGQPGVVGEIMAGILFGPSCLAALWPQAFASFTNPSVEGLPGGTLPLLIKVLSQIGLVLLLFLIGLEFDFSHLKSTGVGTAAISLTGMALPFTLGLGLGWLVHAPLTGVMEKPPSVFTFSLFMGVAMSITALPILGRLLVEWGVARTRLAAITITAAAIDDASGWILLAAVAGFAHAQLDGGTYSPATLLTMAAWSLAFLACMVWVVRPFLVRLTRWLLGQNNGQPGLALLGVLLVAIFSAAAATSWIGIFAIFGAFLTGAILSGERQLAEALQKNLRLFVTAFFLPIFFASTGLRTRIGTLDSLTPALVAVVVLFAAVAGKWGGCLIAARASGFSWREANIMGVLMNTRALMELIVINVGMELGVLPDSMFTMLVIMAVTTTIMTTPLVRVFSRGTEFEGLKLST
jgi:Kef-type K+ transport system membrane component KefB